MAFEEGDVVSRKTGGPLMTVESLKRVDGLICTIWFDTSGRVQRDAFAARTLQKWLPAPEETP